jgi:branched-chain amino acid transport system permease protein
MNYFLLLLELFSIYLIIALSLNIVVGYNGLLSLAHAGFVAIGAYVYALTAARIGFLGAVMVALAVAAVASLVVSLPAWRFRGDYFVVASLATGSLLFSLFSNLYEPGQPLGSIRNLTNGPLGIAGIAKPDIFGIRIDTTGRLAVLCGSFAVLASLVARALSRSPWARLLIAIRDDELAARNLGKSARRAKVEAIAIASAMAALAGVLYATVLGYIDPGLASLDNAILFLSMVMVGGTGNFWGPVVGAGALLLLPEQLRLAKIPGPSVGHAQLLAYGLLLIVLMHRRPQGLAGRYRIE